MSCIGTRWRYIENNFVNFKGELVYQKRVRLLKTKSCNGRCQPNYNSCESECVPGEIANYISDTGEMPELPEGARSGDELVCKFSFDGEDFEHIWFEREAA